MLRKIIGMRTVMSFCLGFFVVFSNYAQGWNVPAEQKDKKSYIKFDATSASQGEVLYNANCASCHGNPGKNNTLKSLNPIPPDLGGSTTNALTDGELLYILNTGRGVMPSFKNVLSEEEMWKVISYMRSFHKNYTQELSKFDPSKSKLVKLTVTLDQASNSVKINATANEKSGKVSLKNADVSVFVKRYFGNLQIGKTTPTDANGNITVVLPKDLPGDKTGAIEVLVKVFDATYGEIQTTQKLDAGVPTDKPGLTDNRAIWGTLLKAPYWIIFLYSLGVILFGLLLVYLLNNLRKLKNSNK